MFVYIVFYVYKMWKSIHPLEGTNQQYPGIFNISLPHSGES